jgi:SAM-dependent methyltransferase
MSAPWQTALDIEAQSADHYLDYVNEPLLEAIDSAPARVLDLGCSTGAFGERLKQRFASAHVTGIEAGRAAAGRAAQRLDHVINARIEEVDFSAAPLGAAAFDVVVAGDVLEHLVNPWKALQQVRPCIAPGGRLIASIPNIRNLQVIADLLMNGRWNYEERGLLDITHLRFFAFENIRALLEDTGYVLHSFNAIISPRLSALYHEHAGKGVVTLRIGRLALAEVTQRELTELCTEQYVVRARPA